MTTPLTPEERRALFECNPWGSGDSLMAIARNPRTSGEELRGTLRFIRAMTKAPPPGARDWSPSQVAYQRDLTEAIHSNPNLPADMLSEALGAGEAAAWANPSTPVALLTGEVTDPRPAALTAALRLFVRLGWWQCSPDLTRELGRAGLPDSLVDKIACALRERADVPVVDADEWLRADAPAFDHGYCVRILVPCIKARSRSEFGDRFVATLRTGRDEFFLVDPRHNDLRPVERTAIRQIVAVLTG